MKFKFTLLIILLAFTVSGYSQLIKEGFEGATFPPTGWTTQDVLGATVWEQSNLAAFEGVNSAYIQFDGTAGEDWLITPQFHVAATDSLSFWVLLEYSGFAPDSLCIKISTTGNNTTDFTTTILKLEEGVNYPVDNATWVRYSVSLQDYSSEFVYIAFKHVDENGDGLFLDNIAYGTPPANDIAATSIDMYSFVGTTTPTIPQATFTNVGSATQTFNVTLSTTGYTSTKTVTALAASAAQQVSFDPWTPSGPGPYLITATATSPGDADLSNNVITATVNAAPEFQNYGWRAATLMTAPRAAHGSASYRTGPPLNDTTFLVLISGGDDTFTATTLVERLNTRTGVWTTLAPVPTARLQAQAYHYNGKIYYIGGYTAAGASSPLVSIYNIATNTWSAGAAMPTAVGDYAGCQYQDSLIYVIGGFNDVLNADQKLVQIYNAKTNTWSAGTVFSGVAFEGGRAAVANNNKIVVVGGFNDVSGLAISQAVKGTISPLNYHNITWTAIAAYPPGPIFRAAAGGVSAATATGAGIAYFTGGDPDGSGTVVVNELWGYDVINNLWKIGPNKITAGSNIENFNQVNYNDSVYLASTGGFDGFGILDVNEWINLGRNVVIPLKLIQFTATMQNAQAMLKWNISEDGLGGYYVVQKSKDGNNFIDLRKLDAGRLDRTVSYQTPDDLPYHGYTYYRLKIVNNDGSFNYSPVRSVLNNGSAGIKVAVSMYPNPAQGMVKLDVQTDNIQSTALNVRITDISGKVFEKNIYSLDNLLSLSYNLKPGTYIVEVNSRDNNFRWNQKLIVL